MATPLWAGRGGSLLGGGGSVSPVCSLFIPDALGVLGDPSRVGSAGFRGRPSRGEAPLVWPRVVP